MKNTSKDSYILNIKKLNSFPALVTHAGLLGIIEGLHDHRMETVIKVLEKGNYA